MATDLHSHNSAEDLEKHSAEKQPASTVVLRGLDDADGVGVVHRSLKARHVQMIAIGGTIGTGLFVGAGSAYSIGGPLGLVLGYAVMGAVVFSMMTCLGEMTVVFPVSGAFVHYASRFVDPSLGFGLGYCYWFSFAITLPTEICVAAGLLDFWPPAAKVNQAVYITIFMIAICSANFLGVRYYGETEFWFSVVKVLTILGLILLGVIITSGGVPGQEPIGFRFWKNPGPFQQLNGIPGPGGRFLAFWATFLKAAFSFIGTEIVAISAGEAENPRRNVPKAIRRVFWRITLFYVLGTFVIGLIVSPNDPTLVTGSGALASPWVIAIKNAGIKGLPSVINAVVISSAFSAGNSDLFASSRTLYGLACDEKAPAIFRKCTKNGLPIWCLVVTAAMGLLSYMNTSSGAAKVFNWLSNLSSVTGLITWASILLTYIRFYAGCKAQGIDRKDFAYRAPFQPYLSYFGLIFICLVVFFSGFTVFLSDSWDTATFITNYIPVPIFALLVLYWKLFKKTSWVRASTMDFETGRRELDAMAEAYVQAEVLPTTWYGKVWEKMM